MRHYNFDSLIDKYTVDFTIVNAGDGYYDDLGEWRCGETVKTEKRGAVIGISESKLYRSDGVLTEKDKQLYMKETLGTIDKAHIIYNGNKYKVEQEPNEGNAQFTGVFSYLLKWVSAFEGGDTVD